MRCQQLSNNQAANTDFRLKFFSSPNFIISRKTHFKVSSAVEIKSRIQPQTLSATNCDCACLS